MDGTSESRIVEKTPLVLAPPLGDKSLKVLEVKLRIAAEEGLFGTAEVAQDVLEFAALASQPGCLHKVKEVPGILNRYAGFLLDAVSAYESPNESSGTLDIWLAEALICIYNLAGVSRDQLAFPIFDAIAKIIARNDADLSPDLKDRLIGALVVVSSPSCRFTDTIVAFIVDELDSRQGRMSPLTLEHCLALLGIARSKKLIGEQVRLVLAAPRGFMSEAALVTRALVTLADLYSLVADLGAQTAKIQIEQEGALTVAWGLISGTVAEDIQDIDSKVVYDCGVPTDGSDVRLVMTLLDLHRRNRKIAGAAFRLLATMCRLTKDHLAAIVVDESRVLILTQEVHMKSRAVNLHATEVILVAAARPGPNLISGAMMQLVARAIRYFPQDSQIVSSGLYALQLIADDEDQALSVLEIIPIPELIRIGEAHTANPSAMTAFCSLLTLLCDADPEIREELVQTGAVAIPFQVMESALKICSVDAASKEQSCEGACAAAARLVLSLTYKCDDAFFHAAKIDGAGIILAVLELYLGNRSVAHAGLMALKNLTHSQTVRRQVILSEDQETWIVLDKVLHIADCAVDKDPDILSQACCAISTLTTVEGNEPLEDVMRNSVDQEYLAKIIANLRWHWPRFYGDMNYCLRLMVMAATEPHKTRLLDDRGNEVYVIGKGRNDQVAAWDDAESGSDEREEPLDLPEPELEEHVDRIRGVDLQRSRKRMQDKVETAEMSIQTDDSTTASGDEHVSVISHDSHEREVNAVLDDLLGSARTSENSGGGGIFDWLGGSEDSRRDSNQQWLADIFPADSEEEEASPGKKRAIRRRMHEKRHARDGFQGKSVPKLGKTPESRWLGGLLTATPEENDEKAKALADADQGEDGEKEDEEEEDWFSGWGNLLGDEEEEEDEKPEKKKEDPTENKAKESRSWFSRGGKEDAKTTGKETAKDENDDEEEEEESQWGDLWATDEEIEAKAERKAKAKEEKERKAREEAEKKKGVFGGWLG